MTNLLSQLPAMLPLAAKWVEDTEASILATGAPLTGQALADATAVGVKHPEKIRVVYGPSIFTRSRAIAPGDPR
jgi:hypothetical protein